MVRDFLQRPPDVAEVAHRARRDRDAGGAEFRSVRSDREPEDERQVQRCIDEDAKVRTEPEQQHAADAGPHQHAELARGRVEAYRALQVLAADDIVQQQLRGRSPEHAGHAVHDQQRGGVPDLQRPGDEQHAPGDRHAHEQRHAELDHAAWIEAVGERARVHRKQQKRQPVRDDGEAAERGRIELAEDHPVADHVLDVVGHHRQRREQEVGTEPGVAQSRERDVRCGDGT